MNARLRLAPPALLLLLSPPNQASELLGTASANLGCGISRRVGSITYSVRIDGVPMFAVPLDAGTPGGETIVVTQGERFQRAVTLLTDGRSQLVGRYATPPRGKPCVTETTESHFFSFSFPGANGVDFQGTRIERIELDLRAFRITPGSTTQIKVEGKVRVYGESLVGALPPDLSSWSAFGWATGARDSPLAWPLATDPSAPFSVALPLDARRAVRRRRGFPELSRAARSGPSVPERRRALPRTKSPGRPWPRLALPDSTSPPGDSGDLAPAMLDSRSLPSPSTTPSRRRFGRAGAALLAALELAGIVRWPWP